LPMSPAALWPGADGVRTQSRRGTVQLKLILGGVAYGSTAAAGVPAFLERDLRDRTDRASSNVEGADAFGAVDLVAGKGGEINAKMVGVSLSRSISCANPCTIRLMAKDIAVLTSASVSGLLHDWAHLRETRARCLRCGPRVPR
jgi:hypothetical protein